ncbi:MAG TPA: IS110 family transposase [Longimicrobiales bacterium]|nr:IS110 family transposase [Longimicrobiales bacterium]
MHETSSSPHWLVGIDLALKSKHKVAIVDRRTGRRVRRSVSIGRDYAGAEQLVALLSPAASAAVVLEPTGNLWRPLAAVLIAAGYPVYLVSTTKVARLRKALSAYAKSDRIDAETLARLLLVDPDGLDRLCLPETEGARLRDLVRHRDRLAEEASDRKRRIQSLIAQLSPTLMEALGEEKFLPAYRALLRRYLEPNVVVRLGTKRLHTFLARRYRGVFDPERTQRIFDAQCSAAQFLAAQDAEHRPFDPTQIQLEVSLELDLLEAIERQQGLLEERIAKLYRQLDPEGLLLSLPGFGPLIAAGVLGETGALERFANVGSYRGYVSLVPRYNQTGTSKNPHQRLRKAGPRLLKKYFYLAAEGARQQDLELAAFYTRLRRRGNSHDQAVCAVANKLAGRAYAVLRRRTEPEKRPYRFRDLAGRTIAPADAKKRVQEEFPGPAAQKRQEAARATAARGEKEEKVGRPSPACARPPKDASSRRTNAPHPISDVLREHFPELGADP